MCISRDVKHGITMVFSHAFRLRLIFQMRVTQELLIKLMD